MFEMGGVPEDIAKEALRLAGSKLSIRTKVVKKEGITSESVASENVASEVTAE